MSAENTVTELEAQLFARAKELYEQGRVEESETALVRLARSPLHGADALYGLGLIRLHDRDTDAAADYFERALSGEPSHTHARYQLGVLAQEQGDLSKAADCFSQVLAIQPSHGPARQRLDQLQPSAPASSVAMTLPATPAGQFGVYEHLLHDPSPLSRQTLAALDRLKLRAQPPTEAFAPSFVGLAALDALAVFDVLFWKSQFPGALGVPAALLVLFVLVAGLIALLLQRIAISQTVFTLERGRLQLSSGLFTVHTTNIELWRVMNIDLRRNWIDRITGHGALVFEAANERREVHARGIAHGDALDALYEDLLNLVFLLRGNPVVKGILT